MSEIFHILVEMNTQKCSFLLCDCCDVKTKKIVANE